MAHRMYHAGRTMVIAADVMGAARAQSTRMLQGAFALRAATAHAAAAREGRQAAEVRLAKARAARAAFHATKA